MGKCLLRDYINNRRCDILGLGVSNTPLAEKLLSMRLDITVYDKKDISLLGEDATALSERGVRFICGDGCFNTLGGELIFRSPGIRPDIDGIKNAVSRGAELTSEIELFLQLTDAETYAITGSDGKTTSTTLTGLFLEADSKKKQSGRVFVGGNIGEPLLYKLDEISASDKAVMELSSFQLMTVKKAPRYAAITNVSPNHLDWHGQMDEYLWAKKNIVGENTLRLVTNASSNDTLRFAKELSEKEERPDIYLFSSKLSSFGEIFDFPTRDGDRAIFIKDGHIVISDGTDEIPLLDVKRIRVPGIHNVENFMTAIGLTFGSLDSSVYGDVADEFLGVRHRLELVRTLDGVDYYNSSIDSSPSRTAAALSALSGRDIVIICGGYDKKIPYEPLAYALCKEARAVVLTGATAKKIEDSLLSCPEYEKGKPEYVSVPDFEEAVNAARSLSQKGGCVLLSPASASFDAFPNFMVRGDTFKKIVEELI